VFFTVGLCVTRAKRSTLDGILLRNTQFKQHRAEARRRLSTQDAAKIAGREDAKKMKTSRQPDRPDVGRIMVGQNAEKATR
jgi:hypothetical protein